ncbi:MAG: hypothetical protein WBE11_09025 [Candidatus Aminicenantaceae bacterium]
MKKIISPFIILWICSLLSFSLGIAAENSGGDSDVGVKWENSSLQTTLEKAQKENKLVLIDFYSPT